MSFSPLVSQLIDALRCLPGVGQKTAQRMALHLLEREREGAGHLSATITEALSHVGHCERCRTLSETALCQICSNAKRDGRQLCIVETPMDVLAVESSSTFSGYFFVLLGRLSPLDGIGSAELKLEVLEQRLRDDALIEEVILATNPTVEGEATANFIQAMAQSQGKKVSRIAYGVPFGGELEYVDSNTLSHAFTSRQWVE